MLRISLEILIPAFHIFGLIAGIQALLSSRSTQAAIAWALLLIMFPYVALPAYLVLGASKFEGYAGALRTAKELSKGKLDLIIKELSLYFKTENQDPQDTVFQALGELPFSSENTADLLIDGDATFSSILDSIDQASNYILMQFFIVRDDELGRRIKERLIKKAKSGIKVYFIYDSVGSFSLPHAYVADLKNAGVNVAIFGVLKKRINRRQLNFRNHRKIVIVDGNISFVGGHNIGDEYVGKSQRFGHWRDTHIKNEGAVVKAVQMSFAYDWYWATGQAIDLNWAVKEVSGDKVKMLAIASGPGDSYEKCTLYFLNAINSAKKRLWLTSPYFIPSPSIIDALQLAALRGVEVRIMLPKKPDHIIVYLASFAYLYLSNHSNIKFFRYKNGFLHQKVFVVDDNISSVGTANFDYRSFILNFEISMLISSRSFNEKVSAMLENDFKQCEETNNQDYEKKSRLFKLGVRLARLFSPIS